MRKFALLALLAAALAVPSIAAAATPQGKLTGSATVNGAAVSDHHDHRRRRRGPAYIGKENDKSGNCDGDSGHDHHRWVPAPVRLRALCPVVPLLRGGKSENAIRIWRPRYLLRCSDHGQRIWRHVGE